MTTVKMLKGDDEYAIQFDVTSRSAPSRSETLPATVAASRTSCQHVVMTQKFLPGSDSSAKATMCSPLMSSSCGEKKTA